MTPHQFSLDIDKSGTYDIMELSNDDANFEAGYLYSDTDSLNIMSLIENNNITTLALEPVDAKSSLVNGQTKTFSVTVPVGMSDAECESTDWLCFVVLQHNNATFTEMDMTNNLFCHDITSQRECSPRMYFQTYLTFKQNYVTSVLI